MTATTLPWGLFPGRPDQRSPPPGSTERPSHAAGRGPQSPCLVQNGPQNTDRCMFLSHGKCTHTGGALEAGGPTQRLLRSESCPRPPPPGKQGACGAEAFNNLSSDFTKAAHQQRGILVWGGSSPPLQEGRLIHLREELCSSVKFKREAVEPTLTSGSARAPPPH